MRSRDFVPPTGVDASPIYFITIATFITSIYCQQQALASLLVALLRGLSQLLCGLRHTGLMLTEFMSAYDQAGEALG